MTDYDDDMAKLLRAKQEILRRYLNGIGAEPDAPDGIIIGPRTREQFEEMMKELDEQDDDLEEDDDEHQTTKH
jgi:hypothetical protein